LTYVPWPSEVNDLPGTCVAFEHAFSRFLHEFLLWKLSDVLTKPPPTSFDLKYQVVLAGTAEFFCRRYDLDMPDWIDDPAYRLPQLTDWYDEVFPELRLSRLRRCQRAAPEFLSRNLIFASRNLITL